MGPLDCFVAASNVDPVVRAVSRTSCPFDPQHFFHFQGHHLSSHRDGRAVLERSS